YLAVTGLPSGTLGLSQPGSPSRMVLRAASGARTTVVVEDLMIPFDAALSARDLSWNPNGTVRKTKKLRQLQEELELAAEELLESRLATFPEPSLARYVVALAATLRLYHRTPQEKLARTISALPLATDYFMKPVSLDALRGRDVARVSPCTPLPPAGFALGPDEPVVLRLSAPDVPLWERLIPDLSDFTERLHELVPSRAIRLEAYFPGVEWWLRLRTSGQLTGELGVTLQELSEWGVWVKLPQGGWARAGLPRHRRVCGVVAPRQEGVGIQQVREWLEEDLKRLEAEVFRRCPRLGEPAAAELACVVENWRDWSTLALEPNPGPLARLALFRHPDGRPATLAELANPPGEEGRKPVSEVTSQSEAAPTAPQPETVQEEPPPMPQIPGNPAERLAEALRSEMRRVAGEHQNLLDVVLFGPTPRGTFCQCTPDGKVTLNPTHAIVAHLMKEERPNPEYLYFVLSALYSVINRARQDIHDQDEREFHRRLLATLLEG
ncbi:MAG: hypothetical protein AB1758_33925, partial [Candidatus Eremiobacterota bacterium]